MKRFQSKPQYVNAVQFTGENHAEVLDFLGKAPMFDDWFASVDEWIDRVRRDGNTIKVFYEDGHVSKVFPMDWVFRKETGGPVFILPPCSFAEYYTEPYDQSEVIQYLSRLAYLQSGGPQTGVIADQWLQDAYRILNLHGIKR